MKAIVSFLVVFFMLLVSSCDKEDSREIQNENGAKTVSVKIATLTTKAIEGTVPTGSITKIEDAIIWFYANGVSVFSHELSESEVNSLQASTSAGTVTINSVPNSAGEIRILANYKASGAGASYSSVSDASSVQVERLQPASGVQKIIMFGSGAIGSSSVGDVYNASVTVTPIASRLEISGIGAKRTVNGPNKGEISTFTLVGVFVPNHYPSGTISNCVGSDATGSGTLVRPTTAANYTNLFPESTGTGGHLNDYADSGLTLTGGDVFGYNVFPAKEVANLPHIVIAVKDVKYISDDIGTEILLDGGKVKYITVTDYYTDANKLIVLDQFKNANVYGVKGLLFGLSDLGDEPYSKAKTVAVTITITPWTNQEIFPDI